MRRTYAATEKHDHEPRHILLWTCLLKTRRKCDHAFNSLLDGFAFHFASSRRANAFEVSHLGDLWSCDALARIGG